MLLVPGDRFMWSVLRRSISLRVRITLGMAGFGIATGAFMSAVIDRQLEKELEPAARGRLQAIAGEVAAVLDQNLHRHAQELALLSTMMVSDSPSDLPSRAQLRKLVDLFRSHQPACAWIGVADPAGRVVAASSGMLEGVDVSKRPWHAAGLRSTHVSDPHAALLLARLLPAAPDGDAPRFVDIAMPLRDSQGTTTGVLAMHLYWHWLDSLVTEAADRHKSTPVEIRILDRSGKDLAAGNGAPSPQRLAVDTEEPGWLSDRVVLGVSEETTALGWSVLVRQRRSDVLAPLDRQRHSMMLLAPVLSLLFAAGTWIIAGRLVRPVLRLAERARQHAGAPVAEGESETQLMDRALLRLAQTDRLTGVANNTHLSEQLAALTPQPEGWAALVLINIDDFSIFNSSQGRANGDRLLCALAQQISSLARPGDLVARTGGGEFTVLLRGLGHDAPAAIDVALDLALRIDSASRTSLAPEAGSEPIGLSRGVLVFQPGSATADEMLKNVEIAAREAKRQGGARAVVFSADLKARFDSAIQLERELRLAIEHGGLSLVLHYQPQIDRDGHCLGAETLVRWNHPEHGMIAPARFIPLAEETGLIVPLGSWVLESACRQLASWAAQPEMRHLVLAVNVSAHELALPDYPDRVANLISRTGADPRRLKLELTETVLASDLDGLVQRMIRLRSLGVGLSMDDFGTGFSSLNYLSRLPIDQLKIDQSFTRELVRAGHAASIVRTIVALGQGLGLSVIAEGVETESQRSALIELGCSLFQGYLLGRPMPLDAFERQVRAHQALTPP
ncbi:putative bifunctional diguanylate cyclase/phosphodiesterase [Sphaerotilus natans]|nr:EAL domain-containing protein [Sphaerotilus natans]